MAEKQFTAKVEKLQRSHGVLLGWALLTKDGNKPYTDLDGDQFDEADAFDAFVDFSKAATLGVMHEEEDSGQILSVMPLTTEVQKALGLESDKAGLAVVVKPSAALLKRYEAGELTGFSVGGIGVVNDA